MLLRSFLVKYFLLLVIIEIIKMIIIGLFDGYYFAQFLLKNLHLVE